MIKNLRYYRELHKMTRKELAEMFGLTEKKLYYYERTTSKSEPKLDVITKLADFFGITVDELIGRTDAYSAKPLCSKIDLAKLGQRLRERREELNLSLKETAERSDITSAYLSFIECGKKTPNVDVFARLLNTLNMSADAALLDSLTAAQDEKSSYLQYKLIGLDPERRLMALRAFECFIEGLKQ